MLIRSNPLYIALDANTPTTVKPTHALMQSPVLKGHPFFCPVIEIQYEL